MVVSQLAEGYWNETANPTVSERRRNSYQLKQIQILAEDFPRICLESILDESEFEIQTPTFALKVLNKKDTNLTKNKIFWQDFLVFKL